MAVLRRAQRLVDAHAEDSLAPFVVRPDKQFAFVDDGLIAYRRIGRTLVVSGDPIGPEGFHATAIRALRSVCARGRLNVAVYGAGGRHLEAYRAAGMHAIRVGEEAFVDPVAFTLTGRPVRKLRQSVQRVSARGWTLSAVAGCELDGALRGELERLEHEWRVGQERILGFAMSFGPYARRARDSDLLLLGRAPDGALRASMRFLAYGGGLSLDTMRRVGETPNGLNEALICHALEVARARDIAEVSLNYAGLAHLAHARDTGPWPARAARRLVLARLGRHFQLERLIRFNDKFGPEWRPRYLVLSSRRSLPTAVLRVLQAEGYLNAPRERSAMPAIAPATQPALPPGPLVRLGDGR